MRTTNRHGGEFIDNLVASSILFPLILPVLLLPSWWILRKKVPISVTVEVDSLKLNYTKSNIKKLHKSKTAYSIHHHKFHSVIVFYSKIKATRGHLLYKNLTDVVATEIPGSWNPKNLKGIESDLIENGFEKREIEDHKIFVLRIIG